MRLFLASFVFFAIDQLSKWIMLGPLELPQLRSIEILPPYLVFKMAWNDGINFGLLGGLWFWVHLGQCADALVEMHVLKALKRQRISVAFFIEKHAV